jgi:uncharacterized membrane protein
MSRMTRRLSADRSQIKPEVPCLLLNGYTLEQMPLTPGNDTSVVMVKVEVSKTVDAPQDKIFSVITEFEKLPTRFPGTYQSLKVIEKSASSVTVEEDVTFGGRKLHQITKHVFEPNHLLRSEVIDGDTKGTVVEIVLEPDSSSASKTTVSVNADLKAGKLGAMLGVFAKGKIKSGLERRIEEFEKIVNRGFQ